MSMRNFQIENLTSRPWPYTPFVPHVRCGQFLLSPTHLTTSYLSLFFHVRVMQVCVLTASSPLTVGRCSAALTDIRVVH